MMKIRNIVIGAAVAISLSASHSGLFAQSAVQPTSEADLQDITTKCQEIAELLWPGESSESQPSSKTSPTDQINAIENQVKAITYTEENIGLIAPMIKAVNKTDNAKSKFISIYVANRLIKPLVLASPATVVKAVPQLMDFYRGAAKFQDLTVYSEEGLKAFKMPEGLAKEDARTVKILNARRDKVDKDTRVKLLNEQILELNHTFVELMAISGGLDRELIELFSKAEKEGDLLCIKILDWLRLHVRDLSQERSKFFYDELTKIGQPLRNKKAKYVNKGVVTIKEDQNSTFLEKEEYPGIEIFKVINRVCVLAREPALKEPKKEDIDKPTGGGKGNPRTQPAGGK